MERNLGNLENQTEFEQSGRDWEVSWCSGRQIY